VALVALAETAETQAMAVPILVRATPVPQEQVPQVQPAEQAVTVVLPEPVVPAARAQQFR
jgi:hypothetical protein